jgi:predicted GIY-YIG superfamily endonuclease
MARPFWAYILRCADGRYYVGHTDDLERRMQQHHDGSANAYTASRRPVELAWAHEFGTRDEAKAAERQLKGWRRAKKEALIQDRGDLLPHLARTAQANAAALPLLRPSSSSGTSEGEGVGATEGQGVRTTEGEGFGAVGAG